MAPDTIFQLESAEISLVAGRFTAASYPGPRVFVMGTPDPSSPVVPRGPSPPSGTVIVLIDGTCFSACETFTEMMMQIPSITTRT